MKIFIKDQARKTIPLDVDNSDSIEDVKAKVEKKEGIPADKQILIFGGKELEDKKKLPDYNIQDKCTLDLILSPEYDKKDGQGNEQGDGRQNDKPNDGLGDSQNDRPNDRLGDGLGNDLNNKPNDRPNDGLGDSQNNRPNDQDYKPNDEKSKKIMKDIYQQTSFQQLQDPKLDDQQSQKDQEKKTDKSFRSTQQQTSFQEIKESLSQIKQSLSQSNEFKDDNEGQQQGDQQQGDKDGQSGKQVNLFKYQQDDRYPQTLENEIKQISTDKSHNTLNNNPLSDYTIQNKQSLQSSALQNNKSNQSLCQQCNMLGHSESQCNLARIDSISTIYRIEYHNFNSQAQSDMNKQPCDICNQYGHSSDECPNCSLCQQRGHGSENCVQCTICQKHGHVDLDCPQNPQKRTLKCGLCNQEGHQDYQCPKCTICGKQGHNKLECPVKSIQQSSVQSEIVESVKSISSTIYEIKSHRYISQTETVTSQQQCDICGQHDHNSNDCPNCSLCQQKGHKSDNCVQCGICQEYGHVDFDCPQNPQKRVIKCGLCGQEGHQEYQCPRCSICRKQGHRDKDCVYECPKCQQQGHNEQDCPMCRVCKQNKNEEHPDSEQCPFCMKCFQYGHKTEDCNYCRYCQSKGHLSEDCPICRKCGSNEHKTDDCQSCENCGKPDHQIKDCPEEIKPIIRKLRERTLSNTELSDDDINYQHYNKNGGGDGDSNDGEQYQVRVFSPTNSDKDCQVCRKNKENREELQPNNCMFTAKIPMNPYAEYSIEKSERRVSASKDRIKYFSNRMNTNYEIKNIQLEEKAQTFKKVNIQQCQHAAGNYEQGSKEKLREEQKSKLTKDLVENHILQVNKNGKMVFRVGGGYISYDEFLDKYDPNFLLDLQYKGELTSIKKIKMAAQKQTYLIGKTVSAEERELRQESKQQSQKRSDSQQSSCNLNPNN